MSLALSSSLPIILVLTSGTQHIPSQKSEITSPDPYKNMLTRGERSITLASTPDRLMMGLQIQDQIRETVSEKRNEGLSP